LMRCRLHDASGLVTEYRTCKFQVAGSNLIQVGLAR